MNWKMTKSQRYALVLAALTLAIGAQQVQAGQGCPFDDGSCQEYCNQQGCNMGYCGHFAWIQCICRKCGDEWSWYDKVRYNPDKTVNQTELDSLRLNSSAPLIITGSSSTSQQVQQQQQAAQAPKKQEQVKTLTTLLIPDLSDTSGRLGLNDIPDENSDKFLDYLAKNHERLAQATRQEGDDDDESQEEQTSTTQSTASGGAGGDEETIEIQISTSNNNTKADEPISSAATEPQSAPAAQQPEPEQRQQQHSPVTRLLRVAVLGPALEDID